MAGGMGAQVRRGAGLKGDGWGKGKHVGRQVAHANPLSASVHTERIAIKDKPSWETSRVPFLYRAMMCSVWTDADTSWAHRWGTKDRKGLWKTWHGKVLLAPGKKISPGPWQTRRGECLAVALCSLDECAGSLGGAARGCAPALLRVSPAATGGARSCSLAV